MKKSVIIFIWLFIAGSAIGQGVQYLEDHQWCFGKNAGLDFVNLTGVKPTPFTTSMDQIEGVASISDINGNLLFYTNGVHVWNSNGIKMKESGTSNDAVLLGHASSTQSSIIIPFVYNSDKYYIFTVSEKGGSNGLRYSVVDLGLGASGEVIQPLNNSVANCGDAVEKITAVLHADGDKYWIITHAQGSNNFYVVLVDDFGVQQGATYSIGSTYPIGPSNNLYHAVGYLKTSSDGSILAAVISQGHTNIPPSPNNSVELFRFDNTTGAITNFFGGTSVLGLSNPTDYTYGIEFSPNDQFLYVSEYGTKVIYQYDLSGASISAIQGSAVSFSTANYPFALQLAPDGLIYFSSKGKNYLGTLLSPNDKYTGQNQFIDNYYVHLLPGDTCNEGLPNFIKAYSVPECPAVNDKAYEAINRDTIITNDDVWSGKIYVASDVTIEVQDAIFDLTNVDMVFAKNAKIDFKGTAQLRANNSVFRSCSPTSHWHGFNFYGTTSGTINECTYKNAEVAIELAVNSNVKITNNLFLNNHNSISSSSSSFSKSISGNTFIIDDAELEDDPLEYYAISIYSSDDSSFDKNISQNDFINASHSETKNLYGITANDLTGGVISNNNFINLYRTFDIGSSSNLTIENNEIEVTHQYPINYQARITQSNNIKISGNQFLSSLKHDNTYSNSYSVAIYLQDNDHIKIDENTINGFDYGIVGLEEYTNNYIFILNNSFENINLCGINLYNGNFIDISCNVINMNFQNSDVNNVTGIYIHHISNESNIKVRQNCIYECTHSIQLLGLYPGAGGPTDGFNVNVYNNFLYNYEKFGLHVMHLDNIYVGSSDVNYTFAGKNTFISNNYSNGTGAIDIFSTEPLFAFGNYGILRHGGNVNVSNTVEFYSTSSCAHQIGGHYYDNESEINYYDETNFTYVDKCDKFFDEWTGYYYSIGGGDPVISDNFLDYLDQLSEYEAAMKAKSVMMMLTDNDPELDRFVESLDNSMVLSKSKLQWLQFHAGILKKDFESASRIINEFAISSQDDADLKQIESINLEILMGTKNDLNQNDIEILTAIDNNNGLFSAQARDLLQFFLGEHDYRFKEIELSKTEDTDEESIITTKNHMQLYPNPSSNVINVKYNVEKLQDGKIVINSIAGKTIYENNIDYSSGKTNIDISGLKPGYYIISIKGGTGVLMSKSFVKL